MTHLHGFLQQTDMVYILEIGRWTGIARFGDGRIWRSAWVTAIDGEDAMAGALAMDVRR